MLFSSKTSAWYIQNWTTLYTTPLPYDTPVQNFCRKQQQQQQQTYSLSFRNTSSIHSVLSIKLCNYFQPFPLSLGIIPVFVPSVLQQFCHIIIFLYSHTLNTRDNSIIVSFPDNHRCCSHHYQSSAYNFPWIVIIGSFLGDWTRLFLVEIHYQSASTKTQRALTTAAVDCCSQIP